MTILLDTNNSNNLLLFFEWKEFEIIKANDYLVFVYSMESWAAILHTQQKRLGELPNQQTWLDEGERGAQF